jgi:hypothetical protein
MSEHRLSAIVIERPRGGNRIPAKKITGAKKFLTALTQEAMDEGFLNPRLLKPFRKTKYLSDHLSPLRRLIRSKVGQPWDQVYSELSRRLDANTMAGRHVLDHVDDYVTQHVDLIDGVPHSRDGGWRRGRVLGAGYHEEFYVHPDTGMLCLAAKRPRVKFRVVPDAATQPVDVIIIDRYQRYQKIDDVWYWVKLADVPIGLPVWDVAEKQTVLSRYPGLYYAVEKRQCNKPELKRLRSKYPQI